VYTCCLDIQSLVLVKSKGSLFKTKPQPVHCFLKFQNMLISCKIIYPNP
jgi:hypothetical protein